MSCSSLKSSFLVQRLAKNKIPVRRMVERGDDIKYPKELSNNEKTELEHGCQGWKTQIMESTASSNS